MLVYIRAPIGRRLPFGRAEIQTLSRRVMPDNIEFDPPEIIERDGTLLAVANHTASARIEGLSALLGSKLSGSGDWRRVGCGIPDGSFALVRGDHHERTELISDAVGSRTLWYACTPDFFVASTSQRAIVMLLRSYEPNTETVAWKISSGTLGPGLSWDRRIHALPPASRLVFDRVAWKTELKTEQIEYATAPRSATEHRRSLYDAISTTFDGLELEHDQWVLPLSGGYDSRIILLMLNRRSRLQTVTWGLRKALTDRRSDARVALDLAAKLGVPHRYFELDFATDFAEQVLSRFVAVGEGRTDRIGGYTDGFDVWKQLYESGVAGVIRGDEAFGCRAVSSAADVYANTSCTVLDDLRHDQSNVLADLSADQRRPERLERRASETMEAWRDRLNLEFEFPYVFAPLNHLKLPYVGIVHPLTSRRIVEQVRQMPDHLRTDKRAFKAIVDSVEVGVPIAKRPAIAGKQAVLCQPAVQRVIRAGLEAAGSNAAPLPALAAHSLELLDTFDGQTAGQRLQERFRGRARRWLPPGSKGTRIPPLTFAFRTYIASKMHTILEEDARML